jgi:hypothetical protein
MKRWTLLLIVGLAGCGPNTRPNPDPVLVSGTLMHDGNPVSDVVLSFQPAGPGSQPRDIVVKDGQFEVELNPGMYTYFLSPTDSSASQKVIASISEEFQQPMEGREVLVQPDSHLELELN